MKSIEKILTVSALSATLFGSMLFAQDRPQDHSSDNRHYVHHADWKKGTRLNQGDWNRGDRVDYKQYHLTAPPNGYEWRQIDGNYVLAASATGLVSRVIVASTIH